MVSERREARFFRSWTKKVAALWKASNSCARRRFSESLQLEHPGRQLGRIGVEQILVLQRERRFPHPVAVQRDDPHQLPAGFQRQDVAHFKFPKVLGPGAHDLVGPGVPLRREIDRRRAVLERPEELRRRLRRSFPVPGPGFA